MTTTSILDARWQTLVIWATTILIAVGGGIIWLGTMEGRVRGLERIDPEKIAEAKDSALEDLSKARSQSLDAIQKAATAAEQKLAEPKILEKARDQLIKDAKDELLPHSQEPSRMDGRYQVSIDALKADLKALAQRVQDLEQKSSQPPDSEDDIQKGNCDSPKARKDLRHCPDLSDHNFDDRSLAGANLSGVNLANTSFRGGSLTGAILKDANLQEADFKKTNLSYADLRGANLEGAKFWNANLTGADLRGAAFGSARLYKAIFTEANLTGVNLYSVLHIKNALSLEKAKVKGATFDHRNLSEAQRKALEGMGAHLD